MTRIANIEMTITLADGQEATARISDDGSIFRGGSYDAMCEIVEPTEAMRDALFDGDFLGAADDEEEEDLS